MRVARVLAFFYGAMIFGSYFFIKVLASQHFALYFTCASFVLCFLTAPFLTASAPRPFFGIFLRGVMYALTNFLLLAAQSRGEVSSSLVAALMGSMIVSVPQLLRPIRKKNFIIVILLVFGAFLLYEQISLSWLAILAGIIQAITYIWASKVMRVHQAPIVWNLFAGFLMVAVIGGVFSVFFDIGNLSELKALNLIAISAVLVISQIAFFNLYRTFPVEAASRYSLGRIPWSFFFEIVFLGKSVPVHTALGALLLSGASFLRKERRQVRR